MKLNKYFMLGLAGLAFAACSNDDENITNGREDGRVRVTLSLGRTESTRSVGQTAAGLYNNITDLKIIFYNSAGAYVAVPATGTVGDVEYDNEAAINEAIKEGLNGSNDHKVTVELKEVPSSATQMYVVANQEGKSDPVGTTSLDDARKTQIYLKNQIKKNFDRFSGEESRLTGLAQIDASTGKANVDLRPVPSRIELADVTAIPLPQGETWGGAEIKSFTVAGFYINAFFPVGCLDPQKDDEIFGDENPRKAIDNGNKSENYTKTKYGNITEPSIAGSFTGDWSMMCDEPNNEYAYADGDVTSTVYTATMNDNKKWGYMILQGIPSHVIVKLNMTYADNSVAVKFLTITSYTYKSAFTDGFGNAHTAGSAVESMLRGHVYRIDNIKFDVSDLTDVPYEGTKTVNAEVEVLPWKAVDVEPGFN